MKSCLAPYKSTLTLTMKAFTKKRFYRLKLSTRNAAGVFGYGKGVYERLYVAI